MKYFVKTALVLRSFNLLVLGDLGMEWPSRKVAFSPPEIIHK